MGRASTAPDRDSGLHLPVLSTNGAYPYLGLGSIPHETNRDSCYGLVGFIPRLNSWAFSLCLCNARPRLGPTPRSSTGFSFTTVQPRQRRPRPDRAPIAGDHPRVQFHRARGSRLFSRPASVGTRCTN
jgi:hypothetical protein